MKLAIKFLLILFVIVGSILGSALLMSFNSVSQTEVKEINIDGMKYVILGGSAVNVTKDKAELNYYNKK